MTPSTTALPATDPRAAVHAELDEARRGYWEDPTGSLAAALRGHERARSLGDDDLRARALALQGTVTLHRGELRGAAALATEAAQLGAASAVARVETAALEAHLSFFTGSYGDALGQAERALAASDETADLSLRVFARRAACLVFGNVGVRDWPERLDELLALSIASGDRWEEAISHNDLGCLHQRDGRLEAAEHELALGLAIARRARAAQRLRARRPALDARRRAPDGRPRDEALADAERAIAHLTAVRRAQPVRVRRDRARPGPGAARRSAGSTTPAAPARARSAGSATASRRRAA